MWQPPETPFRRLSGKFPAILRRRKLADSSVYAALAPPCLTKNLLAYAPKAGFRRLPNAKKHDRFWQRGMHPLQQKN